MNEFRFVSDIDNKRIDVWLTKKFKGYSRSYIQKLIVNGYVSVNGNMVKQNYKLNLGDTVCVLAPVIQELKVEPENIKLNILYEDNDIIVVNKPKGMVVHPAAGNYSGTLVNALLAHCKDSLSDINGVIRSGIVHRIDKDTTGVLVVAKNNSTHEALSEKFKLHDIKRIYIAIVDGVINEDTAKIDAPIGRHPVDRKKMTVNLSNGRKAVTYLKVIERFNSHTFVELKLETGRTHQIRVHMSYIGHPVIGDRVYGKRKQEFDIQGQALHAMTLGFEHPASGKYMEFKADPPEYFNAILQKLRNDN